MAKPKKETQSGPTPWLNKTRVDGTIFTYSENKLLDQITTEIMSAWRNDLIVLRKYHKQITETQDQASRLVDVFENDYEKFKNLSQQVELLESIKSINFNIERLSFIMNEINTTLFKMEERLQFPMVKTMLDNLKEVEQKINTIIEFQNRKRWWHKFFKPRS